MRKVTLLIALFYFSEVNSQIIRANPFYRPFAMAASNLLLDDYTGARAAYSVARKLDKDYTGNCIRVLRSSDNSEQNIGFVGNELDTSALKSFVGTGGSDIGYIVTIYDQSGNGNNATEAFLSTMPKIMNGGVIYRVNGKPSMYFDGGDRIIASGLTGLSRLDAYFVQNTTDDTYIHFHSSTPNEFLYVAQNGNTSTLINLGAGTPTMYYNNTTFSGTNRDNVHDALNVGTSLVVFENFSTTSGSNWSSSFRMFNYAGWLYLGYCSELVFWDSDQSSNRTGIQNNINGYYSIY